MVASCHRRSVGAIHIHIRGAKGGASTENGFLIGREQCRLDVAPHEDELVTGRHGVWFLHGPREDIVEIENDIFGVRPKKAPV